MKKSSLALIIVILAICLASCGGVVIEKPTEGLEFELSKKRTSYEVSGLGTIKGSPDGTFDVVIPDKYDGLPVTAIRQGVFAETGITSVTIPASVTKIDFNAFRDCVCLEKVIIKKGSQLENINGAFYGCTNLKELDISDTKINRIGMESAFSRTGIETLYLPSGIGVVNGLRMVDVPLLMTFVYDGTMSDWENVILHRLYYYEDEDFDGDEQAKKRNEENIIKPGDKITTENGERVSLTVVCKDGTIEY